MDQSANRSKWLSCLLPLYAAVGALVLFVPIMVFGSDLGEILYIFIAAPLVSLVLLVLVIRGKGRRVAILSMMVVYCGISIGLYNSSRELHWATRWLFMSRGYKAELLSQQPSPTGEMRHIEWDGWGWAGAETNVYLVLEPYDTLVAAARTGLPGKASGIPCEFLRVRRLEKQYYAVVYYTDAEWSHCD